MDMIPIKNREGELLGVGWINEEGIFILDGEFTKEYAHQLEEELRKAYAEDGEAMIIDIIKYNTPQPGTIINVFDKDDSDG